MAEKPKKFKESPKVIADRKRRIKWWTDARFGMFVHYGLYAQLMRGEWVMNRERIPVGEYDPLADTFAPRKTCAKEWVELAKKAGMKYLVLTTKHHDGFSMWDSQLNDFNAVKRSPGRDLVAEFVTECRKGGMGVGLYYSLMDWRNPDGVACHSDPKAHRRMLDWTQGLVRELMTNYGKIDVLWYDVMWPFKDPAKWETAEMNAMVRKLQPDILINGRAGLPEDFGTPEGHISPEESGRAWESCITFNGSWGYWPVPPEDWQSARAVALMLRQVCAGAGNLLLNIGPEPDGAVPPEATDRLTKVGKWLRSYGEAVYGHVDRVQGLEGWPGSGWWTRKGDWHYYWVPIWPMGGRLAIGGLKTKVADVRLVPGDKKLKFTQEPDRLLISVPARCPDKVLGMGMVKLLLKGTPKQELGEGPVMV